MEGKVDPPSSAAPPKTYPGVGRPAWRSRRGVSCEGVVTGQSDVAPLKEEPAGAASGTLETSGVFW